MNAQIYEEASMWAVEFLSGETDAESRARFSEWLAISPEHVRAYLELTVLATRAESSSALRDIDVDSLIAAASAESNVVSLGDSKDPEESDHAPRRRARGFAVAACAVGLSAIAIYYVATHAYPRHPIYSTGIGEERSFVLEDGSRVELGAASKVRVHFSRALRSVDLLAGQGLFRVAHEANRPFTVTSGAAQIRAVGTEFDVNRKRSGTVVTVLEGRVSVQSGSDAAASNTRTELAAGEALVVSPRTSAPRRVRADVAAATAWTHDQFVFESAPLADVVDAFNRYNKRQMVIEGPGLDDFHVSGTFPASDPATLPRFLKFLRDQPGVVVDEAGDRIVVDSK